ncbi:MAG: hypothetical protein Q4C47_04345, partial [Planctomycetia bacterium]|nr:hypothetical protein [Planctomycetia bacterium]
MDIRRWSRREWLGLTVATSLTGLTGGVTRAGGGFVSYCSVVESDVEASPDSRYRIGIWTRCWDPAPWRQAFDEAMLAGYTNVGLMTHDHRKPVMTFDMPFEKAE